MKTRIVSMMLIATVGLISACNGVSENKPVANAGNANSLKANANAVTKTAAPTKETLIAIERKAWEDWAAKKADGLDGYMASKFVALGNSGANDRAAALKSWTGHNCEMKNLAFSDEKVTELGDGAAMLTFKATAPITCDGKAGPDPVNVSVLYVNEGGAWKAMYYQEVPAADAKGEYAPPTTPLDKEKELASLSSAPDDLVSAEKKLWDTWKAQDRKAFEEHIADNIVVNGPNGHSDKARYLTAAFESNCKVDTISLGPMKSMEISKDLTMMFYRAAVKGACGKDTIPANSFAATIYKRENGTPKAIYFMESPVRP
ncbi:hypothetical protein BH20ACI2_BH20ACI2_08740 [soil metagenome]